MLRRLATDRAVVVLPRAGKLQRFHRLSTGSGTRVVVRAEPHVFAPEQPQLFRGRCSSVCHRLEPCGTLQEGHANGAGWPVALLADENLGHSLQFWLVGFVDLFTEDKGDDMCVLLDLAGFTQVGGLRAMISTASAFGSAPPL